MAGEECWEAVSDNVCKVSFAGIENILSLDCGNSYNEYTKIFKLT